MKFEKVIKAAAAIVLASTTAASLAEDSPAPAEAEPEIQLCIRVNYHAGFMADSRNFCTTEHTNLGNHRNFEEQTIRDAARQDPCLQHARRILNDDVLRGRILQIVRQNQNAHQVAGASIPALMAEANSYNTQYMLGSNFNGEPWYTGMEGSAINSGPTFSEEISTITVQYDYNYTPAPDWAEHATRTGFREGELVRSRMRASLPSFIGGGHMGLAAGRNGSEERCSFMGMMNDLEGRISETLQEARQEEGRLNILIEQQQRRIEETNPPAEAR